MPFYYRSPGRDDRGRNQIFTLSVVNADMLEPGSLNKKIAEAVGAGSSAAAELRALFLASATMNLAALSQAETAEPWREEALKLQGLAASFGMTDLMEVAARAAESGPDPLLLDEMAEALAACR